MILRFAAREHNKTQVPTLSPYGSSIDLKTACYCCECEAAHISRQRASHRRPKKGGECHISPRQQGPGSLGRARRRLSSVCSLTIAF